MKDTRVVEYLLLFVSFWCFGGFIVSFLHGEKSFEKGVWFGE
jgi:hypothetical protein